MREQFLANASAQVKADYKLMDDFRQKFGGSCLVDPDQMPDSVWRQLVAEALATGTIPERLQRIRGFTTSIVSDVEGEIVPWDGTPERL